ncbi:related to NACHT domain protein [Cephalotrichum gorgonifer]|uniref:Related to NACHT domain protein n=1 Tax=Cephalotrichum gorgonifer TaxID=2041049 RepID=A0AAE8SUT3_9PEZI|nr:related to NACHT domain protein [Cephalotrichum gorgonifer]
MAPSVLTVPPSDPASHLPPGPGVGSSQSHIRGVFPPVDQDALFNNVTSNQSSRRKSSATDTSGISTVVYNLKRRSSDDLGSETSAKLLTTTHDSILEWIRSQRMSQIPPEGSSYDKVLTWAQLFIERLHSFDVEIEGFAGDSSLATQLAYGYCYLMLELGKENAAALMTAFGLFYNMSGSLVNLLERSEMFTVSPEIQENLVLALSDLVTLVAHVSTYFHKAISGLETSSVSVNIYTIFSTRIKVFVDRCENVAESMWRHQLMKEGIDGDKVSDVKSIKAWTAPEDHVLDNLAGSASRFAHDREELTCLWIAPYLTRFLKSHQKTLAISGKQGSGKSILSSVILDHLQHPVLGVAYNTLFIPINNRIPAETTPRAIGKAILSQLFHRRIGNIKLLQILTDAYERSQKTSTDKEYDDIVWKALADALAAPLPGAKDLILLVDGIDEASCGEVSLLHRLTTAVKSVSNIRLITLGVEKPSATPSPHSSLVLTEDLLYDDISAVVRRQFDHSESFKSMSDVEQETIISRIANASHGSFLWAKLATKQILQEAKAGNQLKLADALADSKPSVADLVARTLKSRGVGDGAKHILLWLATSQRPLSLKELTTLGTLPVGGSAVLDRTNPDLLVTLKPAQSLVFLDNGLVYLRHGLIRTSIIEVFKKEKLLPGVKDRHEDLTTRLLSYIKSSVTEQHHVSLTSLDIYDTNQLLGQYPLLDFALRYWLDHARNTPVYLDGGDVGVAKSFSEFLSTSSTVPLIQWTLWKHLSPPAFLTNQAMFTNIYRQLLTANHPATLQSIVIQAMLYRRMGLASEALPLLYEATMVAKSLLGTRNTVTMELSSIFIEMTTSKAHINKKDLMEMREKAILLLIECYKVQYGQSSENVVSTLRLLVEHYKMTHQEQKADETTQLISSITTTEINESGGDLHVRLRGRREKATVEGGTSLLLDIEEHDELVEESRSYDIELSLKKAEKFASEGRLELAQHTYVDIWQRSCREYRVHHSDVWEERKMRAVLAYSKFLLSHKRGVEASSILTSVWQDYKKRDILTMTETLTSLLHEMAGVMKKAGLYSESLSILKHCAQYYQATNHTQSSVYQEIQQSIQADSLEIMQMIGSSKVKVTSESSLEELVLDTCKSGTINQSTLAAVFSLIRLYTYQHRWRDATRLIKRVLRTLWPSLLSSGDQDVAAPPAKYSDSCVELANRLAQCYHTRRRLTKEGDLYLRVYRAMRSSRGVDDELRERVTAHLLRFLEGQSETDKLIKIRQEILDDATDHYGADHPTVVKMLRELAELTRPRPIFIEYYQRLIRTLNKDSKTASPETFEPIVLVSNELWNRELLSEALPYYKVLFATFLKNPKLNPKLHDQSFVQEVFNRYTHCLQNVGTEFSVIHKVISDYRDQCKMVYGSTSSITIQATLRLARVCQDSASHELEAIQLYEELLKTDSAKVDHEDISATLDSIYEEKIDVGGPNESGIAASAAQTARVVKVLKQRLATILQTHGWAHEDSLSKLSELVRLRSQQKETELLCNELQDATAGVLGMEASSTQLIAAASTIASGYIAANQVQKATALQHEIYRQVMLKDTTNAGAFRFDLTSRGRESLVFLAQLEYSLRRTSITMTEILSTLTTQYVYFEETRRFMQSKSSSFHDITVATSRLYQCLLTHGQLTAAARVFGDFVNHFIETEGKRVKLTNTSQVNIFLQTVITHFSTHKSRNFIRSIGICANDGVVHLLRAKRYDAACDLAAASFRYISAHDAYRTPVVAKLVLLLGIAIGGRTLSPQPDGPTRKNMLETSGTIVRDVLHVLDDLKVNLEHISLGQLNKMIGLLGEQRDYRTLSWLLTILWNSRESQSSWAQSTALSLGKRYIMARYLVGDSTGALRLAEDIIYNCRRVHGTRHPATLEMSVLLTQLYTSIAQRHQKKNASGQDMANRYYKKSAAVHEYILRVFTDPTYADMEAGLDVCVSVDSASSYGVGDLPEQPAISDGQYSRQHLWYLKLALERLGSWPKDYAEYERLNADVFREYPDDLKGVEGVEKWRLSSYGSGKAESDDDLLDTGFSNWELTSHRDGEQGL